MSGMSIHTFVITLAALVPAAHAIEEPALTAEQPFGGFELRVDPPVLVAKVSVAGAKADCGCAAKPSKAARAAWFESS